MKREIAYTRRLRRSGSSASIALIAMLFQILFTMEHASAMAVAAAKGGADGTPMGFLEICTAEGLLRISAPVGTGLDRQPTPRSSGGKSCAICGTAAVSDASSASTTALIISQPEYLKGTLARPVEAVNVSAGFKRSGTTRGPPPDFPFLT